MSKDRKVDLRIEMSITFVADDTREMNDEQLAAFAEGEARDQLRVGQKTAGYWSATPAEDVEIEATRVHPPE